MMINFEQLKKAILRQAFQGKLTKQNPEQEESFTLVQDLLKIQKKKYAKFSQEMVPFAIPQNWSWCMMYQAVSLENGESTSGPLLPYLDVRYLRTKNNPELLKEGEVVEAGTKLILVDGENSGEVFVADEKGYKGSTLKILRIDEAVCEEYYFYFIKLYKDEFRKNKTGSAIPHLDKTIFFETLLPVPPIKEQKRIVAILDEIFNVVDNIEFNQNKITELQHKIEKKIIDLAIKGKLTSACSNNVCIDDVYSSIQSEKKRLIKIGEI